MSTPTGEEAEMTTQIIALAGLLALASVSIARRRFSLWTAGAIVFIALVIIIPATAPSGLRLLVSIIAFTLALVALVRDGPKGSRGMNRSLCMILLAAFLGSTPGTSSGDLQALIMGIGVGQKVMATAFPHLSTPWWTDYVSVSHIFRGDDAPKVTEDGRLLIDVVDDGKMFIPGVVKVACNFQSYGVDLLVVRVPRPNRAVLRFGDSQRLRPRETLQLLPFRLFQSSPADLTFVHKELLGLPWARAEKPEFHLTQVARGEGRFGFSGAPWVKEGMVYGLQKGAVPDDKGNWHLLAETTNRIVACLNNWHYYDVLARERS